MIFLFDTNAVSDFMDRNPMVDQHLAAVAPGDRVVTSVIVRGEILYGLERLPRGTRRDALSSKAIAALSGMPCEGVPPAAADHYGRLKAAAERRGIAFDENDLWIAATALTIGAIVITRDADFYRPPGIRLEDWTR